MDDRTWENWRKVKEALEASGKTDCAFYRRAVAVVQTGKDPGPPWQGLSGGGLGRP